MATRRRSAVWPLVLISLGLFFFYVSVRNFIFVQAGMLRPNFGLIHKAYDFNLFELPVTLFVFAFIFIGMGVAWKHRRRAFFVVAGIYLFLGIDLFILRFYVTHVEPERLVLREVRLETPKLQAPLKILHIADIQAGAITDYERRVFETIRRLEPDLILNTGDFLQVVSPATFETEFPKLLALIHEVNPPLGTFAVFGDTERELYRVAPDELAPMRMLSSRSALVDTGKGLISLHGLSLYQSRSADWAVRSVETWLKTSDESAFRILLGHAPDFAMKVGELPIDLCLAGHTHGGQVRIPWYGPLVIDSDVPREWSRGFRRIGIPYLNVSAGAGSNRFQGLPPLRFNCPTEMTLIELVPMRTLR